MKKKITVKTFEKTLEKISSHFFFADKNKKRAWCNAFNEMLDNLVDEDFFGTEGQCDHNPVNDAKGNAEVLLKLKDMGLKIDFK